MLNLFPILLRVHCHRRFPGNFPKFSKIDSFQNSSGWMFQILPKILVFVFFYTCFPCLIVFGKYITTQISPCFSESFEEKLSHNIEIMESWFQDCDRTYGKSFWKVFRSSHWRCCIRKGVPKIFTNFTGKYLCQSLFFNKVSGVSLQLF